MGDQHWSARWLDWGIRGNWLWSVFPATWKAVVVGVIVGGVGALIGAIGKASFMHVWIAFLSSALLYVVMWAIVHMVGSKAGRLSIGGGKVVAHGEVWNPFPMTDRDPRITIEFDPSPAPFGEDTGFRDRKLWLCNDGGTDAFKVQMTRIDLTCGSATFGEIPQIRPRDRAIVKVEILGPAGQKNAPFAVHDLELLMTEEIKNRSGTLDWTPLEGECHINYEDHAKRRFITHATLLHDMTQGLTTAKNYRFFELKLANDRRFQFLKWPKLRRLS
jgi:hypothetical protein